MPHAPFLMITAPTQHQPPPFALILQLWW